MGPRSFQKMAAKVPFVMTALALTLGVALTVGRTGDAFADSSDDDTGRAEAFAQMNATLPATRTLKLTAALKLHDLTGLEELIREQHDPASPNYRRWMTPAEFTQRFGPSQAEADRVTGWLISKGFIIDSATPSKRLIRLHASAATVSAAFALKFAASSDGRLYANLSDPRLPSDLAPLIDWIGGLDNLKAKIPHAKFVTPHPNVSVNLLRDAFGPPDIYSFYDETPLLDNAPTPIDGRNTDCIGIVEDSNFDHASTDAFNTQFDLPAFDYSLAPGTNFLTFYADLTDPGINADQVEALIDLEYAHALAPGADLINYVGDDSNSSTGLGFLDAALTAIDQDRCGTVSISYGICGASAAFFREIDTFFAQGEAQGQSIFIAAGDFGAAKFALNAKKDTCVPGKQRGVEGLESSPHVTSVGGTMFDPIYDDNGNNVGSVDESVWNNGTGSGAGAGGKSIIFKKPNYQQGVTLPDKARDVPDISFGASDINPGFYFGFSKTVECCAGGTSIGAPSWAGISMLIQQELGARPGLINPTLYQLGPSGIDAGIRDVTSGNNSYNGVKGYSAVPGYDQASGWGTPDIADFVAKFVSP
jgi:subtilase family serine protease